MARMPGRELADGLAGLAAPLALTAILLPFRSGLPNTDAALALVLDLFEQLGAFEAGDARFGKFLEGLASADFIPDESSQRRVVEAASPHLRSIGAELRETGTDGGYPVFSVVSTRPGRGGRPKNLIFATLGKPDIRFSDAIDNDIEIVGDVDKVLVYDQPIGASGIRWCDLQAWWKDAQGIADDEGKKSLYQRLIKSLPSNSPRSGTYSTSTTRSTAAPSPSLPALLPEIWLHWDHKTVQERGEDAFRRIPHGLSFSSCPVATGLSWKSTEPATTQPLTVIQTRLRTRTACARIGNSSSAGMRCSASARQSSRTASGRTPSCKSSSRSSSAVSASVSVSADRT